METLMLDSLVIRRFRAFRQLQIPRLGRVNLITGKNNVGKSCVLEALWLYARRGSPSLIWQLLGARDESVRPYTRAEGDTEEQTLAIKYLFYGRKDVRESFEAIEIGSLNFPKDLLSITVGWYAVQVGEGGRREFVLLQPEEYHTAENPTLGLRIQVGTQEMSVQRLDWYIERRLTRPPEPKGIQSVFVPADGLDYSQIGSLWDAVALTPLEEDVLASLRIITPEVERVNLVGDQDPGRRRIPTVKIAKQEGPLPLRSLGEGMNRMFGLALALVNAKDGLLLIDEVESGLHYSIQPDLWRLIFQVARRLNVQVFATTHSWDCIAAFQKAAQEDQKDQGLLIRLSEKAGEITATLFDERMLSIATREQIEVR